MGVCKKNSFESDMPIQKKGGKMEWHKHEKAVLLGPDSPGCFELTEFTFYTGYNEFYDKIPVFELKLADGQYDAVVAV